MSLRVSARLTYTSEAGPPSQSGEGCSRVQTGDSSADLPAEYLIPLFLGEIIKSCVDIILRCHISVKK